MTPLTDAGGGYAAAIAAGDCDVVPSASGGATEAITAADVAMALGARVSAANLSDAQRLAADVSGNGALSGYDAALIARSASGEGDPFPAATLCGSDWLFVPEPAVVAHQSTVTPSLAGGACIMGSIRLQPLSSTVSGQDFDAVLLGDVDASWPNAVPAP